MEKEPRVLDFRLMGEAKAVLLEVGYLPDPITEKITGVSGEVAVAVTELAARRLEERGAMVHESAKFIVAQNLTHEESKDDDHDPDDDGGAGDREPLRPLPNSNTGSAAIDPADIS